MIGTIPVVAVVEGVEVVESCQKVTKLERRGDGEGGSKEKSNKVVARGKLGSPCVSSSSSVTHEELRLSSDGVGANGDINILWVQELRFVKSASHGVSASDEFVTGANKDHCFYVEGSKRDSFAVACAGQSCPCHLSDKYGRTMAILTFSDKNTRKL